jgi:hypothetical protein
MGSRHDARRRLMALVQSDARLRRAPRAHRRRSLQLGWMALALILASAVLVLALARVRHGEPAVAPPTIVPVHGTAHAPGLRGAAVWFPDDGVAVLRLVGLAAAPTGWVYRVWAIRDGRSVPAGVLHPSGRRRFEATLAGLGGVATLAITPEPETNRSAPTGAEVAFISLPQSERARRAAVVSATRLARARNGP